MDTIWMVSSMGTPSELKVELKKQFTRARVKAADFPHQLQAIADLEKAVASNVDWGDLRWQTWRHRMQVTGRGSAQAYENGEWRTSIEISVKTLT